MSVRQLAFEKIDFKQIAQTNLGRPLTLRTEFEASHVMTLSDIIVLDNNYINISFCTCNTNEQ